MHVTCIDYHVTIILCGLLHMILLIYLETG